MSAITNSRSSYFFTNHHWFKWRKEKHIKESKLFSRIWDCQKIWYEVEDRTIFSNSTFKLFGSKTLMKVIDGAWIISRNWLHENFKLTWCVQPSKELPRTQLFVNRSLDFQQKLDLKGQKRFICFWKWQNPWLPFQRNVFGLNRV